MRENHLHSPHWCRPKTAKEHDGKIDTLAPKLMWGTDWTRVFTLDEGWAWIFTAVEHWNAECGGWHVCKKKGDRYAALQPLSMALNTLCGGLKADVARGLALRMNHGPQYLSDHFLNQLKFWRRTPSFAFIAEPQTNRVPEHFNRTLKASHLRPYFSLRRRCQRRRKNLYNREWLLEKNSFKAPRNFVKIGQKIVRLHKPNLCPRDRNRKQRQILSQDFVSAVNQKGNEETIVTNFRNQGRKKYQKLHRERLTIS